MDSLLQTIFFICLEKLELRLKSILFSDFAFCSKIVSKNSNIMSLVDELTIGPMRNWCYTIWLYHSRNVPRANNNFGLIFLMDWSIFEKKYLKSYILWSVDFYFHWSWSQQKTFSFKVQWRLLLKICFFGWEVAERCRFFGDFPPKYGFFSSYKLNLLIQCKIPIHFLIVCSTLVDLEGLFCKLGP